MRTIADVLAQLGAQRAFVVHGAFGIDEPSRHGPNDVCEVVDGDVYARVIDPLELGIERCDPDELRGGTPRRERTGDPDVLAGANGGRRDDAILLNAAGAVAAAGHAEDLGEGSSSRGRPSTRRGRSTPRRAREVHECGLGTRLPARARSDRGDQAALASATSGRTPTQRGSRASTAAGAAAVSVLVDERFGGSWDDLRACASSTVPLLAKGFFSTEEHLRTAKEAGADAVLLPATSTTGRRAA